ncbi:hypothetical protein Y032_0201g1739 [Ancylostoma ceylanicum]|uniref:Uncharacterized protein n=1 Tax=Ancylostoma ceylanicum TaxID=53326 RepID=A0A016SMI3_9BILA|nr:hypothetical protein Y032_0201g1739 [Ancylostoma ceylanicum]
MLLLATHEVVIFRYWPTFRRLRLRQSLKESNRFVKVFGQTPLQSDPDLDCTRKSRITRVATLSPLHKSVDLLRSSTTAEHVGLGNSMRHSAISHISS